MARPLRIQEPGLWYHVMARGNAGLAVFRQRAEYRHFLELLAKACEQFTFEIHAYVLMQTHFHLFVRTPLPNLSRCMQFLLTAYSVWYNRKHERTGHVWQGRYKAIVVDRDAYGSEVSRYIHLNPARAAGNAPLETLRQKARRYPWSSYRAYLGLAPVPAFLHTAETLDRFGGCAKNGRLAYARFVEEGLLQQHPDLLNNVRAQSVLGTDTFADMIKRLAVTHGVHDRSSRPKVRQLAQLSLDRIATAVAEVYGVPVAQLLKSRQRGHEARNVLLWAAYTWCRQTLNLEDIGRHLGGISGVAVLQGAKRVQAAIAHSPVLRHHVRRLHKLLGVQEVR